MPRAGLTSAKVLSGTHHRNRDVFNTVLETVIMAALTPGDETVSGRLISIKQFRKSPKPEFALFDMLEPNIIRNSRRRCTAGILTSMTALHGISFTTTCYWMAAWNAWGWQPAGDHNVTVNNSLHPHVVPNSGMSKGNIVFTAYLPALLTVEFIDGKW